MAAGGDRAVGVTGAGEGDADNVLAPCAHAAERAESGGNPELQPVMQDLADEEIARPEAWMARVGTA
jgi:Cdc6-like AAA superfamily ATPase